MTSNLLSDTEEERCTGFLEIWNFPLCLDAIDRKHVAVRALINSFLIIMWVTQLLWWLQVIPVRMADVRACGLESDGGIFKESIFGSELINCGAATAALQASDVINLHCTYNKFCPCILLQYLHITGILSKPHHFSAWGITENIFQVSKWRIFWLVSWHTEKACLALQNYLTRTDAANPGNISFIPSSFMDSIAADDTWVGGGGM